MNMLVLFTPLEAYTFGTDQSFPYSNTNKTGRESYIATSRALPEQSTLLGTLRYLVLEKKGLLRTDFGYTPEDLTRLQEAIGPESFSFQKAGQQFGCIHALSPLFLYREETKSILIRNPFHNTAADKGYTPMPLGEPLCCTEGKIRLPLPGAYSVKDGYASGFLALDDLQIYCNLFRSTFVSGNRKAFGDERDQAFYRRELVHLEEGYGFAVFADVDVDALPASSIVYMGLKRAAFRVTVTPAETVVEPARAKCAPAELLRSLVEERLTGGELWYVALSDLRLEEMWQPKDFAILEEKSIRNIETRYAERSQVRRKMRSPVRYHLACAGSSFFAKEPRLTANAALQAVGYNIICKLGGD